MRITGLRRLTGLIACGFLSWGGPASGDAVTDWNEIAQGAIAATANGVPVGRAGPTGVMDSALVQIAVHDAVQAIEKKYEPYYAEVKGAKGSKSAAAAAAAYGVLKGLYPAQAADLDAKYFNYLANKGLTGDPGLGVGAKVAAAILPLARKDPVPPTVFTGGTGIGDWRPIAPAVAMFAPWAATFDPYTLTSPTRFRADPPPDINTELYRRDYSEVKRLGALTGSNRTPEQTDIGYFYSENFLQQWNRAFRAIAVKRINKVGDSARLFALANIAMADAFITAWDSKVFHNFWRPQTAIQNGEMDGNPNTPGDPNWTSLIANPSYPDYTSGANNLSGAATRTLALFFGRDNMTFDVTSNAPAAVKKTRTYSSFSAAAQDVVDARVYLGIHFRFADEAARTQGRNVADWVFNHFLLPD